MTAKLARAAMAIAPLLLPLPAIAADGSGAYAVKGVGRDTCEALNRVYEDRGQEIFLVASWLDGYISSVNAYSQNIYDVAPWQSTDLMVYLVAQFCREQPDNTLAQAASWLVQTISPQRLEERSPNVQIPGGEAPIALPQAIVQRVQEELIEEDHLSGSADGAFGPQTRAALESFQQAQEIPVTGVPDQETLFALFLDRASGSGGGG